MTASLKAKACLFLPLILLLGSLHIQAQTSATKVIQLEFNEKGQMVSTPPPLITTQDQITFQVTTSTDFSENRILQTYKLFQLYLNKLNQKEGENSTALKSMGLENDSDAKVLRTILCRMVARALLDFWGKHETVLAKQLDTAVEKPKLRAFGDPSKPENEPILYKGLLYLPDLEQLAKPDFVVITSVLNSNGLSIATDCSKPTHLTDQCQGCANVYQGTLPLSGITDGPVRLVFELRLYNHVYDELVSQINKNATIKQFFAGYSVDDLKKTISNEFIFSNLADEGNITQADIDALNKWIQAKEKLAAFKQPDPQHPVPPPAIPAFTLKQELFIAGLANLSTIRTQLGRIKSKEMEAWILQLAWLYGGQQFSANPVGLHLSASASAQIDDNSQQLKAALKDSARIQSELTLLENASKANNGTSIEALKIQYHNSWVDKIANDKKLDDLRKSDKKFKAGLPDATVNDINKNFGLSDSLFYKGFVFVNFQAPFTKNWLFKTSDKRDNLLHPNRVNYAYMRNHDLLEDFQLKGKDPIKGINETQRAYILIDNAQEKGKYLLKTTITAIDPSKDAEQFNSHGLNNAAQAIVQATEADKDSLFSFYESTKKISATLLAPYDNGVLSLPLKKIVDKTPDYITRLVGHEVPFSAPSAVSYQLIDSATAKPLNSEATTYTYRFNKLYRYRFKAGIVYSFLSKRTYTIDAANNAVSYTAQNTGMAPAFGVQVFTSRLDIQSTRLLPHGLPPYFYFGYLYQDAPGANFLVGGGWEIVSGLGFTTGVHFGQTQRLTLSSGALQSQNYYKPGFFLSLSIGLEAFNALFNTAKPTVNPFK